MNYYDLSSEVFYKSFNIKELGANAELRLLHYEYAITF